MLKKRNGKYQKAEGVKNILKNQSVRCLNLTKANPFQKKPSTKCLKSEGVKFSLKKRDGKDLMPIRVKIMLCMARILPKNIGVNYLNHVKAKRILTMAKNYLKNNGNIISEAQRNRSRPERDRAYEYYLTLPPYLSLSDKRKKVREFSGKNRTTVYRWVQKWENSSNP